MTAHELAWDGLTPPYATIVADPPWPYEARVTAWSRPWATRREALPYSTMTLAEIEALSVGELAAPGAHLYLWTTSRFLWDAKRIAEAWGWRVLQPGVWCKNLEGQGPGSAFTITTEFVLACRRPVGALVRAARLTAGLSQNDLDKAVRGKVTRLSKRWEDNDCYPSSDDWSRLREVLPGLSGLADLALDPRKAESSWWQWPRGLHSAKPPAFLDLVEQVSPSPYVELFARQPRLGWDSWGHGFEWGGAA